LRRRGPSGVLVEKLQHCDTHISREMKVNHNELLQIKEGFSRFISKQPNLRHWARVSVLFYIGNDTKTA